MEMKGVGVSAVLSRSTVALADKADQQSFNCPAYPWPHPDILSSTDNASIRKAQRIFQQVCSSCHTNLSLSSSHGGNGGVDSETRAIAMAAEIEVVHGPNTHLNYASPQPSANGRGTCHLDLSPITKALNYSQNYASSLLTGLATRVPIQDGLQHDLYSPGRAMALSKILNRCAAECEVGALAVKPQMGKDAVKCL